MSFFVLPHTLSSGGGVAFSDVIEILESDDRVTLRRMNPDGSFYHSEEAVYDDDSNSFDLGNQDDDNGMSFVDALEDEIDFDDMMADHNHSHVFQSNRSVLY